MRRCFHNRSLFPLSPFAVATGLEFVLPDHSGRHSRCVACPGLSSFGLSAILKLVSAAGVAPAVAPSRTEHVAATPRAVCPGVIRKDAGDLFFVGSESVRPWTATRGEIRCVGKWQATLVLPQASGVLETLLHKLARGLSSLVEGTLS